MGLHLEASTGADSIEVPVDVELQQIRGIVAWPAFVGGPNPLEFSRVKVEAVNQCINETDRAVRSHVVVHSLWQKQKLGPVFTSYGCHGAWQKTLKET